MDAHAAQQRLRQWQQAGVGLTQAARLTGLARSTLQAIRDGSQGQITPATARAILQTRARLADGAIIPSSIASYETRERLKRFLEEEYARCWLARRLTAHIVRLTQASQGRIKVRTWKRVEQLHRTYFDDGTGQLTR